MHKVEMVQFKNWRGLGNHGFDLVFACLLVRSNGMSVFSTISFRRKDIGHQGRKECRGDFLFFLYSSTEEID